MKRKLLCLLLVLSLLGTSLLSACAGMGETESTNTDESTASSSLPDGTEGAPSDTDGEGSTEASPSESTHPTDTEEPSETETQSPTDATEESEENDTADDEPSDPPASSEADPDLKPDPFTGDYKHVVVIGVDGGGDFLHDTLPLPKLASIFENGAVTYTAQTASPSISAQCWGSLLHGVSPDKHKLTNASAGEKAYPNNSPYPSIFRVIREASPDTPLGSFCAWPRINTGIIEENIDVHKVSGGGDAGTASLASAYFKKNLPSLLFVQFNDADAALHEYGYGSDEHVLALRRIDIQIHEVWRAVQASGKAEDTLFIVTADHGGNGTNHGGDSPSEMNIMFAVAGRTVQKGKIGKMEILDTPSIVLHALGIAPSPNWTSEIPGGIFEGIGEVEEEEEKPTDTTTDTSGADTPPTDPESPTADYKHVVVVGVDGGGDFLHDTLDLPSLNSIFENGAVTYTAQTAYPSISAQCWGTLLHGVTPTKHKLNNVNAWETAYPTDSPYPSIFRVIREANASAVLGSYCAWGAINVGIVENGFGVDKVSGGTDAEIATGAASYFKEKKPTLLFVQFNDADVALHESGFGTPDHQAALTRLDGEIARLWQAVQESGEAESTLFIVTADHGGNGTDHGGPTESEMNIMFAAVGHTVQKGTIGEMDIRDTASIVLHALGIPDAPNWTSRVPSGLFTGVEAGERPQGDSPDFRAPIPKPTPSPDSGAYLTDLIDNEVRAYLTFDGNATDAMGNYLPTENGTLTYVDGFYGSAADLNNGYVTVPGCNFGKDSFSFAFWMNTKGTNADPAVVSNKNWASSNNVGFALALRVYNDFRFSFCNGTSKSDSVAALPLSYDECWTHVIVSVDRENARVGISIDFGAFAVTSIPASLSDYSMDTEFPLTVGQDGTGNGAVKYHGSMDDFIVFDGALDADDVASLAEYYGIE